MTLLGGAPTELAARLSCQSPEIRASEDKEVRPRTTFDHVLVQGAAESVAPLSMEVAGGRKGATRHCQVKRTFGPD